MSTPNNQGIPTALTVISANIEGLKAVQASMKGISICEEDDIELITIELFNAIIQSVYMPPNKQFLLPPLKQASCRNRRFQRPQYLMGTLNNRNR